MLLGTISCLPDKRWVYRLRNTIVITYKLLEDKSEHAFIFSWEGYLLNNSFEHFGILSSERYTTE